jgi:hypothetical protein
MPKRFSAILYFLTALATLNVGLTDFDFMHSIISPKHWRALAPIAILDFGAPTIFLLASITVFRTSGKSKAARWITSATVSIGLMLLFAHHRLGWRPFSVTAGTLISAAFILGSLVGEASLIAGWGTVFYAVLQGPDLVLQLHYYWAGGGSFQHLLMIFIPPALVTASLAMAAYTHVGTRDKATRDGSSR